MKIWPALRHLSNVRIVFTEAMMMLRSDLFHCFTEISCVVKSFCLSIALAPKTCWHRVCTLKWSLSTDHRNRKESSFDFDFDGKTSRDTAKSNIWRGKPQGANSSFELDRLRRRRLSSLSPEMFYFGLINITAAASSRPRGCSMAAIG